jgi:hypothetical protein
MINGSTEVNACMRDKCGPEVTRFDKAASMTSPQQKVLYRQFGTISQQLREGKITEAQAATKRRALRTEANKQPAVVQYRQCMANRCEDAMYTMAAGTVAYIERAIAERRAKRRPIGLHMKMIGALQLAMRERRVTPQLVAETLAELPP